MKGTSLKNFNFTKTHIKLVLGIMIILGCIYAFYFYIVTPLKEETALLKVEYETLEMQLKDINALKKSLEDAKEQVAEKEKEVGQVKNSNNYKPYPYIDFVDFLGGLHKTSGVEIVSLVEDDYIALESHWEVPYNIVLAGEYQEILTFINGLYQSDRFHVVTDIRMHRDNPILTSGKEIIRGNEWVDDIESKVINSYPKNQAPNSSFNSIISPSETISTEKQGTKGVQDEEETVNPYDAVLYLDFSFKFISIDDPS